VVLAVALVGEAAVVRVDTVHLLAQAVVVALPKAH
jgi:hypothetical protein